MCRVAIKKWQTLAVRDSVWRLLVPIKFRFYNDFFIKFKLLIFFDLLINLIINIKGNNMNWNNPDADPGESEEEYEARKREESEAATGLMFMVVEGFIFVLKIAAIFGMFFMPDFYCLKSSGEKKPTNLKFGVSLYYLPTLFSVSFISLKELSLAYRQRTGSCGYYRG